MILKVAIVQSIFNNKRESSTSKEGSKKKKDNAFARILENRINARIGN